MIDQTVAEWEKDPEFQALPYEEKRRVLDNYFEGTHADDEFRSLPTEEQSSIKGNFAAEHLGTPGDAPGFMEQVGDVPRQAARGLAHGALGIGETVGLGMQYVGNRMAPPEQPAPTQEWQAELDQRAAEREPERQSLVPAEQQPEQVRFSQIAGPALADAGQKVAGYFEEKAKPFEQPEYLQNKNVWDNPEILGSPSFWAYNVFEMLPAMAASVVPAAGAYKAIQVGGKTLELAPKAIAGLAKLGAAITGGATAGGMEGAQTYKTVLEQGGSEEEAARAGELMTLFAGGLNSISTGKLFSKAAPGFMSKIRKAGLDGLVEGITEGAEEPAEVVAKLGAKYIMGQPMPPDIEGLFLESLKSAATVAPIAGITGIAGGAFGGSTSGGIDLIDHATDNKIIDAINKETEQPITEDVPNSRIKDLGTIPGPEEFQVENQKIIDRTTETGTIAEPYKAPEPFQAPPAPTGEVPGMGVDQAQQQREVEKGMGLTLPEDVGRYPALPPGQGFEVVGDRPRGLDLVPSTAIPAQMPEPDRTVKYPSSPYNPVIAKTRKIDSTPALPAPKETKALPAGQGFELVENKNIIPPELRPTFEKMKEQVSGGDAKNRDAEGRPTGSTYPDWFKTISKTEKKAVEKKGGIAPGGWSRREFNSLVRKAESGEELTDRQTERFDELLRVAEAVRSTEGDLILDDNAYEIEKKGFEPVLDKMAVGEIKEGDKVLVNKNGKEDVLTHEGYDENGDAVLKDGETIKADPFEQIEVDGIKRGEKKEPESRNGIIIDEPGKPLENGKTMKQSPVGEEVKGVVVGPEAESPSVTKTGYKYVNPSTIETPAQGVLNGAIERKKSLFKQVKQLRQRIKDEPLGGNRQGLRLELLKVDDRYRDAIRAEEDARSQIEKRANELGLTTKKPKTSDGEEAGGASKTKKTDRKADKGPYEDGKFSTTESTGGIEASQVAKSFQQKNFETKTEGDTVTVKTPSGEIRINIADSIVNDDGAAIKMSYGREPKYKETVTGTYSTGEIKLKRSLADLQTLGHELYHHMVNAGLFNDKELELLGKHGDEESQARWIESKLKDRAGNRGMVGKIVKKVRDFIDSLVNAFGLRTDRGVVRDIEKGKVLKREGTVTESDTELSTKKQTDTPAFKKWFKNSKVVDENGEPLVVYHGTTEDFNSFNIPDDPWVTEQGVFFTPSPDQANAYAKPLAGKSVGSVYPVFLSLKNPKIVDWNDFASKSGDDLYNRHWMAVLFDEAKSEGRDGIIINNIRDKAGKGTNYVAFSPTQIKSAIGNKGTFDPNNPDIRLSTKYQEESNTDRARSILERKFNDTMYWMVDKNRPIRTVQKQLDVVNDEIDVFLKETQRPKITANRLQEFHKDKVDPLIMEMARTKTNLPDLELYVHAKHAAEANEASREGNSKRYVQKIRETLSSAEKKEVDTITEDALTPDEWYAALNKVIDKFGNNEDAEKIVEAWKKFSEKPSGMTDAEAAKILETYKGDENIEKLRLMLAEINADRLEVLHDAGQLPDQEYEAIKKKYKYYVPLMREGYSDSMFGSPRGIKPSGKAVKVRGGSTRKVVNIVANSIANYEKAINIAEKARSQRALYGLIKENPMSDVIEMTPVKKSPTYDSSGNIRLYPDMFSAGDNEMRLMVDGEQHLVTVNRDNPDAMLMMRTLKAEDGTNGPILNVLSKMNQYLARINTSWSPEFIVSNFIRDLQTAGINIKDTGVKNKKMFRGAVNSWKAIFAVERGKETGSKLETYYKRFKDAGGKIGWADVHGSVENLAKSIQKDIETERGERPVRKTVKKWLKFIEDANTSVENGVRLHAFRLAVEQGFTDERAAQIASDLTVDFTKKGAAGPVINSLYLFANAGIQGSYRIMRAAVKSPAVRKHLAYIAGVGFTVGLLNSFAGGEDEDGEDYFNKIDDYIRERNAIIMLPGTGGKYAKIPLPWGYNFVWNIGTEASIAFTKENYKPLASAGRLAGVFANAFNPVASGTLLQTLSPTISDPFVQVAENKNWFGGDMMPAKNIFDRTPSPDSQRYWKSTGEVPKYIAEQMNSLTGGNAVKPGLVDVSPETLNMISDTIGGSAVRFFRDSASLPFMAIRGDEISMHKIPFIRRVSGQQTEWTDSRTYYENANEVLLAKEQLKAYKGSDRYESIEKENSELIPLFSVVAASEKELRRLRKSLRKADANGDKQQADEIRKQMTKIYKKFNKKFYSIE